MRKKVNVTAWDIIQGRRNRDEGVSMSCPIDYALARSLHTPVKQVATGTYQAWIFTDGGNLRQKISLPEEAKEFVHDFDQEWAVEPFSFEVEVPV